MIKKLECNIHNIVYKRIIIHKKDLCHIHINFFYVHYNYLKSKHEKENFLYTLAVKNKLLVASLTNLSRPDIQWGFVSHVLKYRPSKKSLVF